jgi:hypothetical protein
VAAAAWARDDGDAGEGGVKISGNVLRDVFKNLRGWMIFVAIVLALRWLLSFAIFLSTLALAVGLGGWISEELAGSILSSTRPGQIYFVLLIVLLFGLLFLETKVFLSFLSRNSKCPRLFLLALFIGMLCQGVDFILQELLLDGPVEFFGSTGGIAIAIGIFHFMSTSKHGKMFFVNN